MLPIGTIEFETARDWIRSVLYIMTKTVVTSSNFDMVKEKVEDTERVENLKKSLLRRRPVRLGKNGPLGLKLTYMAN